MKELLLLAWGFHLSGVGICCICCVRWLDKFTLSHFHCFSAINIGASWSLHEARCIGRPWACVEILPIGPGLDSVEGPELRQVLDLEVTQSVPGLHTAVLAELCDHRMMLVTSDHEQSLTCYPPRQVIGGLDGCLLVVDAEVHHVDVTIAGAGRRGWQQALQTRAAS